jgi:hypothetical protein
MRSYHILGILWFAFCGYSGISQVAQLSYLAMLHPDAFSSPLFLLACLVSLLLLSGVVASWFLFRNALWARRFIRLIAFLCVIAGIAQIVAFKTISVWHGMFVIFAFVSVVLLFLPRHEPVA